MSNLWGDCWKYCLDTQFFLYAQFRHLIVEELSLEIHSENGIIGYMAKNIVMIPF